jgi:hypothetical protein
MKITRIIRDGCFWPEKLFLLVGFFAFLAMVGMGLRFWLCIPFGNAVTKSVYLFFQCG